MYHFNFPLKRARLILRNNEQPRSKLPRYRIQNSANAQIQTATPQQAARNSFD